MAASVTKTQTFSEDVVAAAISDLRLHDCSTRLAPRNHRGQPFSLITS